MTIEKTFWQQRRERRVTLVSLADNIVSESTLSRFEQQRTQLSAVTFIQLIQRMHVDWSVFLAWRPEPSFDQLRRAAEKGNAAPLHAFLHQWSPRQSILARWYVELLLARFFHEGTAELAATSQVAMAQVLKTDHWYHDTLALAQQLVHMTTIESLPTLLDANGHQLQLDHYAAEAMSTGIGVQMEGVLRLLRENQVAAAQSAFEQTTGLRANHFEEELEYCITRILLQNERDGTSRGFATVANILNGVREMADAPFLRAFIPQIAPLLQRHGFQTTLFDAPAFFKQYAQHHTIC